MREEMQECCEAGRRVEVQRGTARQGDGAGGSDSSSRNSSRTDWVIWVVCRFDLTSTCPAAATPRGGGRKGGEEERTGGGEGKGISVPVNSLPSGWRERLSFSLLSLILLLFFFSLPLPYSCALVLLYASVFYFTRVCCFYMCMCVVGVYLWFKCCFIPCFYACMCDETLSSVWGYFKR